MADSEEPSDDGEEGGNDAEKGTKPHTASVKESNAEQVPNSSGSAAGLPSSKGSKSKSAKKEKRKSLKVIEGQMPSAIKKPITADQKDESVASNIKRVCYERGIIKSDGFMDPYKMYDLFREGLLSVEDFMSALK